MLLPVLNGWTDYTRDIQCSVLILMFTDRYRTGELVSTLVGFELSLRLFIYKMYLSIIHGVWLIWIWPLYVIISYTLLRFSTALNVHILSGKFYQKAWGVEPLPPQIFKLCWCIIWLKPLAANRTLHLIQPFLALCLWNMHFSCSETLFVYVCLTLFLIVSGLAACCIIYLCKLHCASSC